MSAVSVLRYSDRAFIFTDGCQLAADRTLVTIAPKVLLLPHLGAAIATRGRVGMLPFVETTLAMSQVLTFDQLRDGFSMSIGAAHHWFCDVVAPEAKAETVEFFLAGWSASAQRAESYLLTSHDYRGMPGHEHIAPWTTTELPPQIMTPVPTPEAYAAAQWTPPASIEGFDPIADGLGLLRAQRLTPCPHHIADVGGELGCVVGGFAQVTVVDEWGCQSSILERWPDEIGEVLAP